MPASPVRAPAAAVLGLLLVLAGAGFESPSLVVPGVALAGLALVLGAWVELARPARLVRAPGPRRIIEGEAYHLRIELRGARLPLPRGVLTDPLLARPAVLGPRSPRRYEAEVRAGRRGRFDLAPASLLVADPIGLHSRRVESEPGGELIVLPRIEPVLAAGRGPARGRNSILARVEEGASASRMDARAIELEVDGLRPYREGSPASRIHWPALARTGELVERRLVAGSDAAPLVVLDAARPDGAAELDAAVRAAASLCFRLASAAGCAILMPGDRRATEIGDDLHAWPAVHVRLALVEPAASPPSPSRALRTGAVFWVAARARAALPAPLAAAGGERFLVVPAGSAGAGAIAFSVGGCEGRRVGRRGERRPLRSAA
jgi:uncharacterized protein (DUF58 family)